MSILERALQAYQEEVERERREAERRRQEEIELAVKKLQRMLREKLEIEVRDDQITVPEDFPFTSVSVTIVEPAGEVTFFTRRYPGSVADRLCASVRCDRCHWVSEDIAETWSDLGWVINQRLEHERNSMVHQEETNASAEG